MMAGRRRPDLKASQRARPAPFTLQILLAALALLLFGAGRALALTPVAVSPDMPMIDLADAVEIYRGAPQSIEVTTPPGPDGVVNRFTVPSRNGDAAAWAVFALANETDEPITRVVVAPHFQLAGSGLVRPDLGSSRIRAISSQYSGEATTPVRQTSNEADVFLFTLEPGALVTFVAELATPDLPTLELWDQNAYEDSVNSYTLYRGILLGISGLLALFLTIIFIVKGSLMFPAVAALAWSVLAYLCIDFDFWQRVFGLEAEGTQFWRAASEVMIALTLIVFLHAYLNLTRWHVRYRHVVILCFLALVALLVLATQDASLAAGIARVALAVIAALGLVLIVYLAAHGYDRAIMIVPTWLVFIAWLVGMALTVAGEVTSPLAEPALAGGLVLVVMLLGFTVMQHAFSGGAVTGALMNDAERRALALTGAGDIIWDWDVARDRIHTSMDAETGHGISRGRLEGPARDWIEVLHPQDRDRFRATLDAVVAQRRGRTRLSFRLRTEDGLYRWFLLRARPIIGGDGEVIRCVGTLVDITDAKTAEERLLHDAVRDNLTGLPNRELFFDRLGAAIARAQAERSGRPAVFLVDIDRFRHVNESLGLTVADSILLTVARRLGRLLKPQDTLARLGADQYGIILLSEQEPDHIAAFAEAIKRAVRAPITFAEREIFLTVSVGIAILSAEAREPADLVKDAEIAMTHAKREGGDRIETYHPGLRPAQADALTLESDLRRAIDRDEIKVLYQPIVRVADRAIAGYEALLRWDHPKRGRIPPVEFVPTAEQTGLIVPLGLMVLERAARQLAAWHELLPGKDKPFVSVNVSSRQLMRHDLINDVKAVLTRTSLPPGALKLELTESLVMENPEYAAQMLARIRELGAGLALDDFGTGYSSLSYLHRFPFDTLKIDQSFVAGGGKASKSVILKSMIALAHDLGLDVVVEGVETEKDLAALTALGADHVQGFVFGQPLTAEEVRKTIEKKEPLRA